MSSSESSDLEIEENGSGDAKPIQSPSANQDKKRKRQWHGEDVKQLIQGVIDQIPSRDLTPWDKFDVNFDNIESTFTSEECRQKWDVMITKVRQYRTIQEVAQEMLMRHEVVNQKASEWNKDIKRYEKEIKKEVVIQEPKPNLTAQTKAKIKYRYPKQYPPKPKTGYMIFTAEKYEKFRAEGVVNNQIFAKVSALWRLMTLKEKAVYFSQAEKDRVEYLEKLKTYAESHSDDSSIKTLIKNEEKILSKKNKKRAGISESFDDSDVSRNHSITEYMVRNHKTKQTSSISEDESTLHNSTFNSSDMSPSQSTSSPKKKKLNEELLISPVKKRKVEDEDSSSTMKTPQKKRKKKKKKRRVWTAEGLFIDHKKEAYKASRPHMEDGEVFTKLKSKYIRLTDKKKGKWERLAQERNEEEQL